MCAATGPSEPQPEPPGLITSRRNPLVARLRDLHTPRGRRRQGEILLEGTHLLQEALRLGLEPSLVLATPAWWEGHSSLLAALPATTPLRTVSGSVLEAAASTLHPDGVLATLATPPSPDDAQRPGFILALDALQDPGNLGTLLRTALAAGVEQVWLEEGADPFQPKVLRASSGAALALPLQRLAAGGLAPRLDAARRGGLQVLAAVLPSPHWPDPLPYWHCDWTRPTLLLLGNEGRGLDPALAGRVDATVTIPHNPELESLNVAVAAAPLLLERWRQRCGGGCGGGPGSGECGQPVQSVR
jgi:TrmH family RNA methyltransferase